MPSTFKVIFQNVHVLSFLLYKVAAYNEDAELEQTCTHHFENSTDAIMIL